VISACAGPSDAALPVFLIRSDGLEIGQLANLLIQAVSTQLETSAILEAGYPEVGKIAFEPDPSNPNGQLMHCEITLQPASDNVDCLILDGEGSFIRLQVIDWESAAFYAYRVYLVPDRFFYKVNPAKDFVALDFFLLDALGPWEGIDHAIRMAARDVGARSYRP